MGSTYEPKQFWESRLDRYFSLKGVGHIGFSESYNKYLYKRKKRVIEYALKDIELKKKSVLDIGCGTGFFIDWYLQHGANVCGIDITNISIERLKQKYQCNECEFYLQDITSLDYKLNKKFDIVNMWDVIYHIIEPNHFEQALDNITNSIKDNGLLLFTDWFGFSSDKKIANHVQARCLDTYKESLSKRGFKLVEIYPLYNYLNRPHLGRFDNYLGWLYLFLDNHLQNRVTDNLSLGIWRYSK